jgi:hypothetical protein
MKTLVFVLSTLASGAALAQDAGFGATYSNATCWLTAS